MLRLGQHSPKRRRIARQLVGDHNPRLGPGCGEYTPQEGFGGALITSLLNQDVEDDTVLIDCPPQPVALAFDLQLHLVQVPFVAHLGTSSAQSRGVARAELRALGPDRLVRDSHAPLGKQLLDVTQTQTEAEVEPHGVTNDLCRVTMTAVRRQLGRDGR